MFDSVYKACRGAAFVGNLWDMGVGGGVHPGAKGLRIEKTFCAEGSSEEKATEKVDEDIDKWCKDPKDVIYGRFDCHKVDERGPVEVTKVKGFWKNLFEAIVRFIN